MPIALEIVYSIVDADGHPSTTSVRIPSDTAMADAVAFADDVATLLDKIIDGVITRAGISTTVTLPGGLKAAALDNCDVEVGATLFYSAGGVLRFQHRIPTFKKTLIVAGGSSINETDPDVAAFIAMMKDGLTPVATLVQPSEWRDTDIVAFTTGNQTFTKTRS